MKEFIKKFIPKSFLELYHFLLSYFSAWWYGFPSEKLIVIGVTGTNGKTTTVNLIAQILEAAGCKVGLSSTVRFKIGPRSWLNDLKMTMPGRFFIQRMLSKMVKAGCQYAILELSSEGVLQYRHLNIHYDVLIFTNLAPEHIERHGSFENYKQAKLEYFRILEKLSHKIIKGKKVPKVIVASVESKFARDFLNFKVDKKYEFSFYGDYPKLFPESEIVRPEEIKLSPTASTFKYQGLTFKIPMIGPFNVENSLKAIAVGQSQGISLEICKKALKELQQIPGRQEFISEGQDFRIMIDYAPEPNSLKALYETIKTWPWERLIHVLGSTGGGRDKSRRKILGKMAGEMADIVIVTNEDPYDEAPQTIIDEVSGGAIETGKILGEDLFKILDRREAIRQALCLASAGDLVIITGKGAEQAIVAAHNKKIPWDDREVVREELEKLKFSSSNGTRN
jgi:UDP-N-acetylmuramoyl-L-alanyl-D-glutamate--2,6-diaminopimelate ligase